MTFALIVKSLLGKFNATKVDFNITPQTIILGFSNFPKIASILNVAETSFKCYGGGFRCTISALLELIFMSLVGPALAVAITVLICGFFFLRQIHHLGRPKPRPTWPQLARCLSRPLASNPNRLCYHRSDHYPGYIPASWGCTVGHRPLSGRAHCCTLRVATPQPDCYPPAHVHDSRRGYTAAATIPSSRAANYLYFQGRGYGKNRG
ncbi:hypothetical protein BU23DRAFT_240186 [Bimuria novae-zelandiae CBS 107.79]|uniref:Uncharacterized protein n=1 Tax=Bimuria novae-zelandiae CBS 107.79 TaxID=1447943 RepID=A0A6A5UY69_9PLEO|nr:hypothetical protein BU23DRAFT_240186 [Bimuria novae-zelandiae CBS 107.79]